MTPEQNRKFNTTFGSVFLCVGALAWSLTVYYALVPNPPAPLPSFDGAKVDIASCRTALESWGYRAQLLNGDVTAFESLSGSPQLQLDKATMAITVCKLPLKSFCMGEGCEAPGLTLVLQSPKEVKAIKDGAVAVATTALLPPGTAPKKVLPDAPNKVDSP
ncbi:MAG: hypothetical protein Q7S87_08705 [Agitococcus sp.]|nr:hypothetical protein [Agitococcus sp.]MDO9176977.1 hypothetical protein [Agitococcus sp.]